MKIDLETSKKGNNFLGKEEVGSSNLLVGSTDNQLVTLRLSINNNSLRYYIGIFDCFLCLYFSFIFIGIPLHCHRMMTICSYIVITPLSSDRLYISSATSLSTGPGPFNTDT